VKLLVDHIKKGKPKRVFITDGDASGAAARGYAKQTVGAEVRSAFTKNGSPVVTRNTGLARLGNVQLSKLVTDADVLVNFSHVKGHGACGFGGACKNLAMGCIPDRSRKKLHSLEGDLTWSKAKCTRCGKCINECPVKANKFNDKGGYEIFWHNCRMCLHCMLACPSGAIKIANRKFDLFQEGLARVANLVLKSFSGDDVFHINVLTNITIFCDCWGFTSPCLVPDIGIIGGQDIVAVDRASLDAIKVKDLIPNSITPPFNLGRGRHLFERIHHCDPYEQLRALVRMKAGSWYYRLVEIQ
jgi:uncharacterized Fe-S center protein